MTTWFSSGADARVGEWATVDVGGRLTTYRFVHEWAVQDSRSSQLTELQQAALTEALRLLPRSPSPAPAPADVVLVSYRQDGRWRTRAYDRTNAPEPVVDAFEAAGIPLGPDEEQGPPH